MTARFRRLLAPLTLAVFVSTLALPFVPGAHTTWDDDADGGLVLSLGHPTAAVGQPSPKTEPPGHCALCHWLRVLASVTVGRTVSPAPVFFVREVLGSSSTESPFQPPRTHKSSRAPPAAFFA